MNFGLRGKSPAYNLGPWICKPRHATDVYEFTLEVL